VAHVKHFATSPTLPLSKHVAQLTSHLWHSGGDEPFEVQPEGQLSKHSL